MYKKLTAGLVLMFALGGFGLVTAPSASANPRGVFLCVENASDGPVRVLMNRRNDTNDDGPNVLLPGMRRCAESTPQVLIGIRPGDGDIVGDSILSWRVEATRENVAVRTGVQSSSLWITWRTPVSWTGLQVGETRRATVPPLPPSKSPDWRFTLKRFANNENVGGGLDTSGNQWIRYLLIVKEKS